MNTTNMVFDRQKHMEKMAKRRAEMVLASADERFWGQINRLDDITQCWLWKAGIKTWWRGKRLYPMVSFRKMQKNPAPAHRVVYFLHYGVNPKKGHVCHRCGNHLCCNPHHLYLGTAKTNHDDAVRHGSFVPLVRKQGEETHNAKLTVARVLLIRKVYPILSRGEKTVFSEMVGVCREHLKQVADCKSWSHVTESKIVSESA